MAASRDAFPPDDVLVPSHGSAASPRAADLDGSRVGPAARPLVVPARGRIRREALDPDAVFVVRRLQEAGHEAYLVGGCVRDLLLGLEPKDFDVATDATPNRIKRLFRNAWVIGRRFRLVHVRFPEDKVIETATFRAPPEERAAGSDAAEGPIHDDNVFGTAAEDAFRRDFTVNALFYDPAADVVVDHVGGLRDLETRTIRAIGDPATRLREDPVRMIRAVHFAARLGGSLEPSLRAAFDACGGEIAKANGSRLYIELIKVLGRGCARPTLRGLHELGVLGPWMPELARVLDRPIEWPSQGGGTHEAAQEGEPEDVPTSHATWNLLGAADAWGLAAHGVPESLRLACLFGPWLLGTWAHGPRRGHDVVEHVEETFRPLALRMSVPRRVAWELRDILWLQQPLHHPPSAPRRVRAVVHRPTFPEALAYFRLDLAAHDRGTESVERWRAVADEVWTDAPRRARGPEEAEALETGEAEGFPRASFDAMEGPFPGDAGAGEEPGRDRGRRRRRGGRGRGRGGRERAGEGRRERPAVTTEPSVASRAEADTPVRPPAPAPRPAPSPEAAAPARPPLPRPSPPRERPFGAGI